MSSHPYVYCSNLDCPDQRPFAPNIGLCGYCARADHSPESLELWAHSFNRTIAQAHGSLPTLDRTYAMGKPGAALTTRDRMRALIVRGRIDSRRVLANRWGVA